MRSFIFYYYNFIFTWFQSYNINAYMDFKFRSYFTIINGSSYCHFLWKYRYSPWCHHEFSRYVYNYVDEYNGK